MALSSTLRHVSSRAGRAALGTLPWIGAFAPLSAAQDAEDVRRRIEEVLSWTSPETPGAAVAVMQEGELLVEHAMGSADLEEGTPLTPDTRFDAGSLVKQFVAAAVLLLVEDERCALDDDVRKYLPELPEYADVITIDHLLTHTSGVRDWVGLRNFSSVDEDALTRVLRQRGLNFAPGEEWSYSNSGYVLLKELVQRLSGKPFSAFARERLFEPLGMRSTAYVLETQGQEKLAVAYEPHGSTWQPDVLLGNERGGGGALLSTAGDLVRWNEALATRKLGTFVSAKLDEPARLKNGRQLGYSRGLFLENDGGRRVIWHTGSAAAYKAMLSRYPEHRLSIAVLSNAGERLDRGALVHAILDVLGAAGEPAEEQAGVRPASAGDSLPDAASIASRGGMYFHARTGDPLLLMALRSRLMVMGGGELVPISEDRFRNAYPSLQFRSEDDFEVRFDAAGELHIESKEGELTTYHRARPEELSAEELQALAGRYESEELVATMRVEAEEGALRMSINGSPPVRFQSGGHDRFHYKLLLVRFLRDAEGEVAGLEFTNPGFRRVGFSRATD